MISDSTLSDGDQVLLFNNSDYFKIIFIPLPPCGPSQILPYLFLGSSYAASNDKPFSILGITHIVNATLDIPCLYEGPFTYLMVEVEDDAEVPIGDSFAKAHEFIEEARKSGGKVLVRAGCLRLCAWVASEMFVCGC